MKQLFKLSLFILVMLSGWEFQASAATCNWASRNPTTYFWDSCNTAPNQAMVNGYISFNVSSSVSNCFRYQWKVNGNTVGSSNVLYYTVTQNGTYTLCVTVTDTCNNCDTTICSTRTINCFSNCNWASRKPNMRFWDSCHVSTINGFLTFNNTSTSCFKYKWKINGNVVSASNSAGNGLYYTVTQNGTYTICLTVTDTCNNCDTTFCSTRTINCFSNICNWASRYPTPVFRDSCNTSMNQYNLFGYISFNSSTSCFKYKWKVNGNLVTGSSNNLTYPIAQNGSYTLCVTVTDTCNNCDTTFCSTRNITCVPSNCNWASRYPSPVFSDSCNTSAQKYFVNGKISFNVSSAISKCFKYKWKINGNTVAGAASSLSYPVTQNGSYTICVTVTDTCSGCDTTFCGTRNISCIPAYCNWAGRNPIKSFWDSCNTAINKYTVNGYLSFNSPLSGCFKYKWKVNGNLVGSGNSLSYPVTQNGTYTLCVTVTDTCNNCDTTICSTRIISCINNCNWKSRIPTTVFWDSCNTAIKKYWVYGYVSFNSPTSCFKYKWKVNGNVVPGNNGPYLTYPVIQNGTYNICVTVTDTCNNCDTTFCGTRVVSCVATTCNWKGRNPTAVFRDTCDIPANKYNLFGYISFNSSTACFKYKWKVNGNVVAGNGSFLNYPVTQNGTYSICVTVTDTCNNCDTTFCGTRVINCIGNACHWSSFSPYVYFYDTCLANYNLYSVNGSVYFNSSSPWLKCFKYQWKINGNAAGNGVVLHHPVTQNGTYAVCLTVTDTCNNCDTTFCGSVVISCITPNSIRGISANTSIQLYPNPAHASFKIRMTQTSGDIRMRMMDMAGRLVMERTFKAAAETEIMTGNIPAGTYMVEVSNGEGIERSRLLIIK